MIELFIAVAIIGILAFITVPRLPGFIQKAQRVEAAHMMSQVREAELAYNTQFPGEFINVFAGLPWDVAQQSKTFNYSVNAKAGTITATRISDGVVRYQMNINTGAVTEF